MGRSAGPVASTAGGRQPAVVAFVLDSTWALITTAGALVVHAVAGAPAHAWQLPGVAQRAPRPSRLRRGSRCGRGFLTTIGNVSSGASGRAPCVVEVHEHVHVWQARWFGPLYPLVYGVWTVLGAVVRLAWLSPRTADRSGGRSVAYYRNPFEWWAYSREGRWPRRGRSPTTSGEPIRAFVTDNRPTWHRSRKHSDRGLGARR